MDDGLLAAVGVLSAALGGTVGLLIREVRRGSLMPRFPYDREVKRSDLVDARLDKLTTAIDALTRAQDTRLARIERRLGVDPQTHDGEPLPPDPRPARRVKRE